MLLQRADNKPVAKSFPFHITKAEKQTNFSFTIKSLLYIPYEKASLQSIPLILLFIHQHRLYIGRYSPVCTPSDSCHISFWMQCRNGFDNHIPTGFLFLQSGDWSQGDSERSLLRFTCCPPSPLRKQILALPLCHKSSCWVLFAW